MKIILYSNDCPRCRVLKQKLDSKSIQYDEEHSVDKMLDMGISQVPILYIDGKMYDFQMANKWINNQKKGE